jgi:hypothetical protein
MIYNVIQYLRDQFPLYKFVMLLDPVDKQDSIVVRPTGGTTSGYPMERVDGTFQVIVRSQDRKKAFDRMNEIYLYLKETFSIDLPAAMSGSTEIAPILNIAKISANQYPGEYNEASGVYGYVCNFTVIFSDKIP